MLFLFCIFSTIVIVISSNYEEHYVHTTQHHCLKVPKEDYFVDYCNIWCIERGSCSFTEINCFPHRRCALHCNGAGSCNNARINALDGVRLRCGGIGSCQGIKFTSDRLSPFNPNEPKLKYNWTTFKYNLNKIQPKSNNSELINFNKLNNIQYSRNFISISNYIPNNIRLLIKENWLKNRNEIRNKARAFGYSEENITGHNMTFLNDCFNNNLYKYFKNILKSILYSFKEYTLDNIDSNDNIVGDLKYQSYISKYWSPKYDWQSLINMSNIYEARVIEYITYKHDGKLGWHYDDHSNITMVVLISNDTQFEGGELNFMESSNDINYEKYNLTTGDIIIFPSISKHKVLPIISGERQVLVIEWWNLPKNNQIGRQEPGEVLWYINNKDFDKKRKEIQKKNRDIEYQKRKQYRNNYEQQQNKNEYQQQFNNIENERGPNFIPIQSLNNEEMNNIQQTYIDVNGNINGVNVDTIKH